MRTRPGAFIVSSALVSMWYVKRFGIIATTTTATSTSERTTSMTMATTTRNKCMCARWCGAHKLKKVVYVYLKMLTTIIRILLRRRFRWATWCLFAKIARLPSSDFWLVCFFRPCSLCRVYALANISRAGYYFYIHLCSHCTCTM